MVLTWGPGASDFTRGRQERPPGQDWRKRRELPRCLRGDHPGSVGEQVQRPCDFPSLRIV